MFFSIFQWHSPALGDVHTVHFTKEKYAVEYATEIRCILSDFGHVLHFFLSKVFLHFLDVDYSCPGSRRIWVHMGNMLKSYFSGFLRNANDKLQCELCRIFPLNTMEGVIQSYAEYISMKMTSCVNTGLDRHKRILVGMSEPKIMNLLSVRTSLKV